MWTHYKKTFAGMQITIAIVLLSVYFFLGHSWPRTGVFFIVMQVAAVIGALWAARIKGILERRSATLPLKAVN